MTTPKLLLSNLLRHSKSIRILSTYSSSSSTCTSSLYSSYHISTTQFYNRTHTPRIPSIDLYNTRYFSTHNANDNLDTDSVATQLDVSELGLSTSLNGEQIISETDSILPVRALISMLDGYHDLSGFPWLV